MGILGALVVLLQIRWSPPNHKIHVDGTVFAYGGQRLLAGDLPYLDFWDHKPPGVFYLNALAFAAFGGPDAWSVWYLTVVWSLAVAASLLWLLRQILSLTMATIMSCAFLGTALSPGVYEGPNLTKFYGLLPAILACAWTWRYFVTRNKSYLLALGCAFTVSALLKHTGVATPLACVATILVVEMFRGHSKVASRAGLLFLAPATASALVVLGYWGIRGGLPDLWEATVEYNLSYVGTGWNPRLLYAAIRWMAISPSTAPLLSLSLGVVILHGGYALAWTRGRRASLHWSDPEWSFVAFLAALALEVIAVSILANRFQHYYLSTLPALTTSAAYWLRRKAPAWPVPAAAPGSPATAVGLAALAVWAAAMFGVLRPGEDTLRSFASDVPSRRPLRTDVGTYIRETTRPEDRVLWWGVGAELNFETGRRSPTRYVYSLPLLRPGFAHADRWAEFLLDLRERPPALIVSVAGGQFVPEIGASREELLEDCRCDTATITGLEEFFRFVKESYVRDGRFVGRFEIYRLRAEGAPGQSSMAPPVLGHLLLDDAVRRADLEGRAAYDLPSALREVAGDLIRALRSGV
jgi:hypothetical protein